MRALVWIVEDTWEATVAEAAAFLPADAEITLLHVAPSDVETLAEGSRQGLLGRRRQPPPPPPRRGPPASRHGPPTPPEPLRAISDEAAEALLAEAGERLGRDARTERRRGRIGHEVVAAADSMDLLVLARDGDRSRPGPRSLGPAARFAVDHAPCRVLLVWAT
jgi:nucleotide-binding universal stress UspA family protein